jgi:hypothetical protein
MHHDPFERADLSKGPLFLERGTAETYAIAHGLTGKKPLPQEHFETIELHSFYLLAYEQAAAMRELALAGGEDERALKHAAEQLVQLESGAALVKIHHVLQFSKN